MAMKLLSCNDQFVADFDADQDKHHFLIGSVDIVQDPEMLNAQFELSQRIWPQPANRVGLQLLRYSSGGPLTSCPMTP